MNKFKEMCLRFLSIITGTIMYVALFVVLITPSIYFLITIKPIIHQLTKE